MNAQTDEDARTQVVDSTSVECIFCLLSTSPLPDNASPTAGLMACVSAVSSVSAAAASEPGAAAVRAAAMDVIAASAKTAVPCPLACHQGLADIACRVKDAI